MRVTLPSSEVILQRFAEINNNPNLAAFNQELASKGGSYIEATGVVLAVTMAMASLERRTNLPDVVYGKLFSDRERYIGALIDDQWGQREAIAHLRLNCQG